jgi:hypothetical protein
MRSSFHFWTRNRPSRVFYSVAAQEDNLGDVVIRVRMLEWIRGAADETVVYVGAMSDDYLAAFDFDDRVKIVHSKGRLMGEVARSLLEYRIFLVLPPGPGFFGGMKNLIRSTGMILATVACTLTGGGALQCGASFRSAGRFGRNIHRLRTRLLRICSLRDTRSFASSHAIITPDLAFAAWEPNYQSCRFRLTLSLRSDYPVNEQLIRECKEIAEENQWQLTFVTQVQRDDEGHEKLASSFGADLVSWAGSHKKQLELVKQAYAESVGVLTDRLHGLIFASNSGALPLALVHAGNDKLTSTFEPIGDILAVEAGSGEILDSVIKSLQCHADNPEQQWYGVAETNPRLEELRKMVFNALA